MSVSFINIDKERFLSKSLCKYMPLERALDLLNNSQIWFANPTTWDDPFEKRFIETKYLEKGMKIDFPWKNRIFCVCMSKNPNCEAYWNTYAKKGLGICLVIDPVRLLAVLEDYSKKNNCSVYIGAVEYQETKVIKGSLNKNPFLGKAFNLHSDDSKAKLMLLKRKAFEYEDEIRFIVVKNAGTLEKGIKLNYSISNTDLVKVVKIDPRAGLNETALLKKVFDKEYGFSPASKRVFKSGIYSGEIPSFVKV